MAFELFAREISYIVVVSLGGSAIAALFFEWGQMGFSVSTSGYLSRSIHRFQAPTRAFLQKSIQSVYAWLYVLVIFYAFYRYLIFYKERYLMSLYLEESRYDKYLLGFCWKTFFALAGLLLSIALIDWIIARSKYRRSLMMDDEEMRRAMREEEGDPHLKSKRKAIHHSLVGQDLIQRVRRAKVVVVD